MTKREMKVPKMCGADLTIFEVWKGTKIEAWNPCTLGGEKKRGE